MERRRAIQSPTRLVIPDVIISEMHADTVTVTRHPVDTGASIADHAYREPAHLVCEFGWSDSSALLTSAIAAVTSGFTKGLVTIQEIYSDLRQMMEDRELLTVSTGKRQYQNMLITGMKTTTTVDTEACLIVEITLDEVMLVEVQTKQLAEINQAQPSRTAEQVDFGRVMPEPLVQPPQEIP